MVIHIPLGSFGSEVQPEIFEVLTSSNSAFKKHLNITDHFQEVHCGIIAVFCHFIYYKTQNIVVAIESVWSFWPVDNMDH